MLQVLLLWLYISVISLSIGKFVLYLVEKVLKVQEDKSITHVLIVGMVTLTVYAQMISIFTKVAFVAHMIMLLLAIVCAVLRKSALCSMLKDLKFRVFSLEGFIYFGIIHMQPPMSTAVDHTFSLQQ